MKTSQRDDLDKKALERLVDDERLSLLFDLVLQASQMLFDAVGGKGSWQSEFNEDQRRIMCQRIVVRMVGELFKPEETSNDRPFRLH
jgi:hypothetical protein